jgi:signal-transduction protein with cAMP-binding, CBS, and nucleotidyltransferase domain
MRIGELCARSVVTCEAHYSAADLARLMRKHHVGDVVVVESVEGGQRPLGIVTDRDLVLQVLAAGVDPATATASSLMSPSITALASEGVYDAIWHMRRKGCRRLPVVDAQGKLAGLVTLDDVTQFLATELTELGRISQRQQQLECARMPALP